MSDSERLREEVLQALRGVASPTRDRDVVTEGMVEDLRVSGDGDVGFDLRLRPSDPAALARRAREAASAVEGVASVRVQVSPEGGSGSGEEGRGEGDATDPSSGAAGPADPSSGAEGRRRASGRSLPVMGAADPDGTSGARRGRGAGGAGGARAQDGLPGDRAGPRPVAADREAASRHPREAPPLEGVEHVVAVSSGKGGVGKSTVATNLAAAWAREGHRVGLLDADVYGPDIPTMFGVVEKPRMDDGEVIPLEAHGVKLMSIGFIVEEDTPVIWRGPIIQGIVRQFLQQVRWGELDYLVVDLPPGTGDAQLSLVQLVRVSGGVFVTTPQDVAVGGVLKGIRMFERLEIPVLGLVENMRGFVCPSCGEEHDIFGAGGGEKLAASLGLPFLGAVPLGTAIREESDRGMPTVLGRPDAPESAAFRELARRVDEQADPPPER